MSEHTSATKRSPRANSSLVDRAIDKAVITGVVVWIGSFIALSVVDYYRTAKKMRHAR